MSRRYDSGRHDTYRPRAESKTDNFFNALEGGHFRDAIDAIRPGGGSGSGSGGPSATAGRRQERHHHHSDRRGSRAYSADDDDDDYYYYSDDERPRRHHQHRHSSHVYSPEDDYDYPDERPHHRGRSTYTESYASDRSSRDRQRRHSQSVGPNWSQATKAAVAAGLIEGWKSRNKPGRTARIATAAVGAAAMDALVAKEGDRKSKRHIAESTIGGLMLDRIVNGTARR